MFNQLFTAKESEVRFLFTLVIALSLLVVTSFVMGSRVERGDVSVPTETAVGDFPKVALRAKSAYVYDTRTKEVIFALNENKRMPLASLAKVMAALVAEEISPSYGTVTITPRALATEGDSGLFADERWTLRDLLDFSLVSSSNDGIRAIALSLGALKSLGESEEEVLEDFVRAMNAKATELELRNTYFSNETGLDESEVKGGAYGTAKDMATLMEYIMMAEPEMLEATRETETLLISLDNFRHVARNTNAIAREIPGLLASKTGFTTTAGGNLVLVFDPELGRPIVVSILGSTAEGRFEDAKTLIAGTLQYINGHKK